MKCAGAVLLAAAADAANMNGEYLVASGGRQGVAFNTDYASKGHEYFDIYSPEIATHYGEVFWTDMGDVAVPDAIRERFAGKVMAITGYEQDQVMKTPEGDVSVPINWAYNHHYMAWMTGKHSKMVRVAAGPDDPYAHGATTKLVAVDLPSAAHRTATAGMPTSQMFSEGNGGESRKSFHGYPNGYAQLIDSPEQWRITPMQIDTRNRDCGANYTDITNCTKRNPVPYPGFTPDIEPRTTRFGTGIPKDTKYSGLLECPCNSRYGGEDGNKTKIVEHSYGAYVSGQCSSQHVVSTAYDCFSAVQSLAVGPVVNVTISDAAAPKGCSVRSFANGTKVAYFNKAGSGQCGASGKAVKVEGQTVTPIKVALGLSLDPAPAGGNATITLSGPADVWFAAGLNATQMRDQPYTIVVTPAGVVERKLGTCGSEADHCPGTVLSQSVTVLSNTVSNNVRTVVLTRPFKGATAEHFTFDLSLSTTMNFIAAFGKSADFAYHAARLPSAITLISSAAPTCVCDIMNIGKLCAPGGIGCNQFVKNCVAAPAGDLLSQQNPTCNSRQYVGGLQCCGHRRIMLDADQPVRPELLRYHMKFRFWFQEYKVDPTSQNASHENLPRIYYQTEAWAGEYDVPPAFGPCYGYEHLPNGTMTPGTSCTGTCPHGDDCECEHTITYRWNVSNMRLIYAGGHCHAPSCISMELYREDTGALLCRQVPVYGKGNVTDKFDEEGYIALPPCLWGDDGDLDPSVFLPANTPMLSVKRNRNTRVGHYGEMASWQMRGVYH